MVNIYTKITLEASISHEHRILIRCTIPLATRVIMKNFILRKIYIGGVAVETVQIREGQTSVESALVCRVCISHFTLLHSTLIHNNTDTICIKVDINTQHNSSRFSLVMISGLE